LDLALQEANTEAQKKEIEEQLKRLRDNQQELLQDTDEVLDRMNRESNQQSMQESRERMEQARQQLQQSSQAIEQQQPSTALASGSRAQQMMEETRESLRQQSASGLEQNMRELLEQADALERRQQQLQQRMPGRPSDPEAPSPAGEDSQPGEKSVLRPEANADSDDTLAKEWQSQREALEELLENVKETVTESESSEPLLAEELYETYRQTQRDRVGERLEQTSQMLERGLDEPARALADQAGQGIQRLREQIEQSSESVLGSEQRSLNRALRELDRARDSLQSEQEPSDAQRSEDSNRDRNNRNESGRPRGPWNMEPPLAPLLGEQYPEWNDSIREVEELVRDPELKAEAARIREAAREMRIEYKRHANVPEWPLVERLITEPMDELRTRIAQELLRKTAEKNQIVPLDRDPVPRRFHRALDSYFERLGSESSKP
jgi:hypothetical protein